MRLVTRADLDGLACAVLLRQVKTIETVKFAHPKDMQDGRIPVDRE
jgi:oligoribonuclease NrnB/cAMP/cGMP phosphodiesterase (DHH superfamily)